jgi:hypothetical protein
MRFSRGIREVAMGIAALLFVGATRAQQPPCNAAPFLAVSGWTGTVAITGTGSGTLTDSGGNVFTYNVHQSIQLGPVLTVSQTNPSNSTGPENATFNVNDTWTTTQPGFPTSTTVVTASGTTALGFFNDGAGLSISSLPLACGYSFGADDTTSSYIVTVDGQSGQGTELNWGATNIPNLLVPPGTPTSPQTFVPFPTSGTTLSGSVSFNGPSWDIPSNFPISPAPIITWTVSWSLSPTPTPLDLIVTIPNYDTWRPSGGLTETDYSVVPGQTPNALEITAQLVFKDTQTPADFGPNKVTFALTQVSSEPGVAMNWPPKAKLISPAPPDLSFKDLNGQFPVNVGFTLNADGTQATLTPASTTSNPLVSIFLLPYDWGGWATLSVTADVAGQPTLYGHLAASTSTDILLPKRQPGSFVANSWKIAHNIPVTTPDNDDSETNPVGDGQPGDGLTLYEEYRGFYMGCTGSVVPPRPEGAAGCQRAEGDPAKKDLFVVDRIPTIAGGGIRMFKQTTGLNVHYLRMTVDDVGAGDVLDQGAYRVVNFNHAAAPHEVDQHALVVRLGPQTGYSIAVGGPGLPKQIDPVAIQSDWQNLRNRGAKYLASFVAHELAHSVDVYHHGDIDEGTVTWIMDSSGNITENGNIIYVKNENDDPSVSTTTAPVQNLGLGPNSQLSIWVGNNVCNSSGQVVLHGQHSGDVTSYMRYDAAGAYIPLGFPNVRFLVPSEPFGVLLGNNPAGTGVNDPNRKPRSRYGDAYPGNGSPNSQRGNNASQLDVNDNNVAIVRNQTVCP